MRRPGRNHSAAFKAKVALAAVKGDKTRAERAERYAVHVNQITQWKAQLLDGATGVFLTQAERGGGSEREGDAGKIGQPCPGERFFGRRARSHRRCERKQAAWGAVRAGLLPCDAVAARHWP